MRVYKNTVTGLEAIAMVARVRHGSRPRVTASSTSSAAAAHIVSTVTADGAPAPVIVRIQDQCMTSEIFGSVKCDCKQQLDFSMAAIQAAARVAWAQRRQTLDAGLPMHGAPSSVSLARLDAADDCDSENSAGLDTVVSGHSHSVGDCDSTSGGSSHISLRAASSIGDSVGSVSGAATSHTVSGRASPDEVPRMDNSSSSASLPQPLGDDDMVGAVIYLLQEGRGIGLAAKVSAYALQEGADEEEEEDCDGDGQVDISDASEARGPSPSDASASAPAGASPASAARRSPRGPGAVGSAASTSTRLGLDTVDANRHLGLPDDVREYSAVVDILSDLQLLSIAPSRGDDSVQRGSTSNETSPDSGSAAAGGQDAVSMLAAHRPLRLLTNNPRKLEQLRALGVPIAERVPCHVAPVSPHAARYLRAKAERMGHAIPAELYTPRTG